MKNVGDPPAGTSDHPVWDLFGITLWHCLGGDLMHAGCLGIVPWLLGSVLWELVCDGPFDGNADKRVKTVWPHILDVYDALNVQNRFGQNAWTRSDHQGRLIA